MEGVRGVMHCESRWDGFRASGDVSTTNLGGRDTGEAGVRRRGVSAVLLFVLGVKIGLDEGVAGTTVMEGTGGKGGKGRDGRRRIPGVGFGIGGNGRIDFVRVWRGQQTSSSSRLLGMGERVEPTTRPLSATPMTIVGLA